MFYCKYTCKLASYVLKKSKNVILYEVFKTIWTRVRTCQKSQQQQQLGKWS